MNEVVAIVLVAVVGIIGMVAIAYFSIRTIINTTKHANEKRESDK